MLCQDRYVNLFVIQVEIAQLFMCILPPLYASMKFC